MARAGMLVSPAAGRQRTGGPSHELVLQMLDHQARQVDHLLASEIHAITPLLEETRKALAADLSKIFAGKQGSDKFEAAQLRNALVMVDATLKKINGRGGLADGLDKVLRDTGAGVGALSAKDLNDQLARFGEWFEGTIHPIQLQEAAVIAAGDKVLIPRYASSATRYSANVQGDIKRQISIGFLRGETFDQMTKRLVALGGPRGLVALRGIAGQPGAVVEQISEGLFKRYGWWAERIVRTEGINAYNEIHVRGIEEAALEDEDLKLRWDAANDWRTCPICGGLDGQIVDVGALFPGGFDHAPAHSCCRCTVVPWKITWEKGYVGHPMPAHDQAAAPTPVDPRRRQLYQVPDVGARAGGRLPEVAPEIGTAAIAPPPAAAPPAPPLPKPIALTPLEAGQVMGPSLAPAVADAQKAAAAATGQLAAEYEKLAARLAQLHAHQIELAALPPKKATSIVAKGQKLYEKQAAKEKAAADKVAAKQLAKDQKAALKEMPKPIAIAHVPEEFSHWAANTAIKYHLNGGVQELADIIAGKSTSPSAWKHSDMMHDLLQAPGAAGKTQAKALLAQAARDTSYQKAIIQWSGKHGHLFPDDAAHPAAKAFEDFLAAKKSLAESFAEHEKARELAAAAEEAKRAAEQAAVMKARPSTPGAEIQAKDLADAVGMHGRALPSDHDWVENQSLHVRRFVDTEGAEWHEFQFKVTAHHADELAAGARAMGAKGASFDYYEREVKRVKITGDSASRKVLVTNFDRKTPVGQALAATARYTGSVAKVEASIEVGQTGAIRNLVRVQVMSGDPEVALAEFRAHLDKLGAPMALKHPTEDSIALQARAKVAAKFRPDLYQRAGQVEKQSAAEVNRLAADVARLDPAARKAIDGAEEREVYFGHRSLYSKPLADHMKDNGGVVGLYHDTRGNAQQVANVLTDTGLMSSRARYDRGVFTTGMSTSTDFGTGGADGVFTRIAKDKGALDRTGATFRLGIDHKELGRLDWWAFNADRYGAAGPAQYEQRWKVGEIATQRPSGGDEVMFPHGIRPEQITHVVASSQNTRAGLIDELSRRGIREIRGIPIEEFVRVEK